MINLTEELVEYARRIAVGVARSSSGRSVRYDAEEMVAIAYLAAVEACQRADPEAYPKTYFYRYVQGKCLNALRSERRRRRVVVTTEDIDRCPGDCVLEGFASAHPRRVVILVQLVVMHGLRPKEIPVPMDETREAVESLRMWLRR